MSPGSSNDYFRYRRYLTKLGGLYQQKKVRAYTEIVLSIFTVAFFLFFAIKPTAITIASLIKKTEDQKLVAESLDKKVKSLIQAQKNYQTVEPNLGLVETALPPEPQVTLFAKTLEILSQQTNVSLKTVNFNQVALKEKTVFAQDPKEIKISLAVAAGYDDLKNFLQQLDSLRRTVLINSFGFSASKSKTEETTESLDLSLQANIYYLPKPEELKNEQ